MDGGSSTSTLVASTNTGVFANTPSAARIAWSTPTANQLAFLGSQQGNALEQDLAAVYKEGCSYRLTVGVGVSARFPPSAAASRSTRSSWFSTT